MKKRRKLWSSKQCEMNEYGERIARSDLRCHAWIISISYLRWIHFFICGSHTQIIWTNKIKTYMIFLKVDPKFLDVYRTVTFIDNHNTPILKQRFSAPIQLMNEETNTKDSKKRYVNWLSASYSNTQKCRGTALCSYA